MDPNATSTHTLRGPASPAFACCDVRTHYRRPHRGGSVCRLRSTLRTTSTASSASSAMNSPAYRLTRSTRRRPPTLRRTHHRLPGHRRLAVEHHPPARLKRLTVALPPLAVTDARLTAGARRRRAEIRLTPSASARSGPAPRAPYGHGPVAASSRRRREGARDEGEPFGAGRP